MLFTHSRQVIQRKYALHSLHGGLRRVQKNVDTHEKGWQEAVRGLQPPWGKGTHSFLHTLHLTTEK